MLLLRLLKATDCAVRPLTAVSIALDTDMMFSLIVQIVWHHESRKHARICRPALADFRHPVRRHICRPAVSARHNRLARRPIPPLIRPRTAVLASWRDWPEACILRFRYEKLDPVPGIAERPGRNTASRCRRAAAGEPRAAIRFRCHPG